MRGATAGLLVVLATLLAPLGVTAAWLSSTIDSTESYVDTVAPLAEDPELRAELADAVSEAAVSSLQTNVPVGLPGGVEGTVHEAAVMVTENEDFPAFWRKANRDAHREFLALVDADDPAAPDGWVMVDLSPLVQQVYDRIAEAGVPVDVLPPAELNVPVVQEQKLAEHRSQYRVLEGMAIWLPVVWAVLVGLAVLVARGWRGRLRTLGFAGIGLALGALLVRVAAAPATDLAVDAVDSGQRDLVSLIAGVVIGRLESIATVVATAGGLVGLVLVVASVWGRRPAAPYPPAG